MNPANAGIGQGRVRSRSSHCPSSWYEFNLSRARASHDGTASYEACDQYWSRIDR
jgi:hypothetical protein